MISKISSINDKIVDSVVKLKVDKKFRYESGLFAVEGIRMVRDAVHSGATVKAVFIDKTKEEYIAEFSSAKTSVYTTECYILNKMSAQETPQGILATVAISARKLRAPTGSAVILDGIRDPGNAGSIMRTALAAGVNDIYFVNSVDPYNPKTVKSSMSAVFHLNIFTAEKAQDVLPLFSGTDIVCADMDGENVFKTQRPEKFALVIGNEGAGIREEFLAAAKKTVAIPMDKRVESLNAAASAAILLYALKKEN